MKFIHTADLHIGQIIYQNYDRSDEHRHFFNQLKGWCEQEQPDALLVSGDVFDVQQPSASTRRAYTDYFVELHNACKTMRIIITAGNHDSPSRLEADRSLWELANTTVVGLAPTMDLAHAEDGWQEQFIVRLASGYVIAFPHMMGQRREALQRVLDYVQAENRQGLPVVLMAHLAVTGADVTGHNVTLGNLQLCGVDELGAGYDYLALGHIHKPQTIGHPEDVDLPEVTYPSGVVRYSGSALHVSCDERYPHSVSVVRIDGHNGDVTIKQLRIDELRHFYTLPLDGTAFSDEKAALTGIEEFCKEKGSGYFRVRMDRNAVLSANFNQMVYALIDPYKEEVRFNPKIEWAGDEESSTEVIERPVFEVADLQQMKDPLAFISQTADQYPDLDMEMVRVAFTEVMEELNNMDRAEKTKKSRGKNAREGTIGNEDINADLG